MHDLSRKIRAATSADVPALDIFGAALFVLSDDGAPVVVGKQTVPPGYGVPPHVHAADDEMFYIVEGELTLTGAPEGEVKARPGSFVQLPRGVPHGFRNDTELPARMLVVVSPGVQALEMFRHFDRAGRAGRLTPQEIGQIAAQYGVSFV